MYLYLAGVWELGYDRYFTDPAYMHRKSWSKYRWTPQLESYWFLRKNPERFMSVIAKQRRKIFLDSGAYSAFTQGVTINLDEYAAFIHKYKHLVTTVASVDVIGAGNEQESYDNLKALESLGCKVQPTHHARDDDKWLCRYLDEGYNYIFLGGMVPESSTYLKLWLDRVWGNILTKKNGKARVQVHGFGLTVEHLMCDYPWYSVDSTSWKIYAAMSFIVLPTATRHLQSLAISDQAPSRKQRGRHYNHLSQKEKKYIKQIVKKAGFKISQLKNDAMARAVFNSLMYRKFMKNKRNFTDTFYYSHKGLF